jgi:hypothetical protein
MRSHEWIDQRRVAFDRAIAKQLKLCRIYAPQKEKNQIKDPG